MRMKERDEVRSEPFERFRDAEQLEQASPEGGAESAAPARGSRRSALQSTTSTWHAVRMEGNLRRRTGELDLVALVDASEDPRVLEVLNVVGDLRGCYQVHVPAADGGRWTLLAEDGELVPVVLRDGADVVDDGGADARWSHTGAIFRVAHAMRAMVRTWPRVINWTIEARSGREQTVQERVTAAEVLMALRCLDQGDDPAGAGGVSRQDPRLLAGAEVVWHARRIHGATGKTFRVTAGTVTRGVQLDDLRRVDQWLSFLQESSCPMEQAADSAGAHGVLSVTPDGVWAIRFDGDRALAALYPLSMMGQLATRLLRASGDSDA